MSWEGYAFSDIQRAPNPDSSEIMNEWHEKNPDRFHISDGHMSFSITKEEAEKAGLLK